MCKFLLYGKTNKIIVIIIIIIVKMNSDLDTIQTGLKVNKLTLNVKKTKQKKTC